MDFITFALILNLIIAVDGGKEKNFCNVCRAVVEEANWKISQSDQTRTIQVGSFRVDPHGNQKIKEKTYARSESHVEDIFEEICEEIRNYAQMEQDDGSTTIVRTRGHNGKSLQTKDYNLDMSSGHRLRYLCHDFLEDYEEAVIASLQREDIDNYEQVICGAETGVCSGKELSIPLIQLPEVVEEEKSEVEDEEDSTNPDDEEARSGDTEEGDALAAEFAKMVSQDGKEEL